MAAPQELQCDRSKLAQLLAEELTPDEEQSVCHHLDKCESCQRALEELAAGKSLWGELQSHQSGAPTTDLWHQQESANQDESNVWIDSFLHLLDPTDDPHMLGRLGCFEIRGVIGRGGNGIVLKAFEPRLNRFVAIKVLAPAMASSAAARRRFEREGRAIAAVSHEHVVPIYAVDEHRGATSSRRTCFWRTT
jgi:serine/threonine-protein kinase